jgi:hypothetical protein
MFEEIPVSAFALSELFFVAKILSHIEAHSDDAVELPLHQSVMFG